MARNKNKERPGIVCRFDWIPTLEKMSSEGKARFIMSALHRGRDPTFEPDLSGLDIQDEIRLETLWTVAAPAIDSDGESWAGTVSQRQYAGYSSSCARRGEEPMSFEDFKIWRDRLEERDPGLLG